MIQRLCKFSRAIACALMTFFYCQAVLSAYEPWRNGEQLNLESLYKKSLLQNSSADIIRNYDHAQREITSPDKKNSTENFEMFTDRPQREDDKIGGPTQPEMTAFKSVGDNNMVDLFSGNFSYNIPLLDVGGYPINLFYQSGITMDQEASWVGLGWNINPGTITRNLRGVPDDFDGKNDTIQKRTFIAENKTIGGTVGGDIEVAGLPLGQLLNLSIGFGVSGGVFYNNYRGWGTEKNFNASISAGRPGMGSLTAGLSVNDNSQEGVNVSTSLSAQLLAQATQNDVAISGGLSIGGGYSYNSRSGLVGNLSTGVNLSLNLAGASGDYGLYGSRISFASPSYNPSVAIPFTSNQFTFTGKMGGEIVVFHPSVFLRGYVTKQGIADPDIVRTFPAYGYLHYQDANENSQALLDFNREKEIIYRDKPAVPNIAIPSYTYDLFCMTGEGTGGMFRAYRSDIGFVHDPYVTTKDFSGAANIDLGFGNLFHAGVDININHAKTTTGSWTEGNPLTNTVRFKQTDSVFEATYLRNPGEKTVNSSDFYKNIGDDDVVTAQLFQASTGPFIASTNYLQHWKNKTATNVSTLLNSATNFKSTRDKRSQVISYLTAAEASRVGLDTIIYNYGLNKWGPAGCSDNLIKKEARVNGFRQPNHISEIDVLNADGRRYVYGLPVYNLIQKDVTFAAASSNGNKKTGLYGYTNAEASEDNTNGKDHYFQQETTSPYAHSFLLTSILSPDYVDVTGNGISDDDLGDAIRFNYTKIAGKDSAFGWRTPFVKDSAAYNEGLQSYSRDDKASFIYGEKEMWYLNSVESKNMIAIFVLQKRSDLNSVNDRGSVNDTTKSKCLKEINLYSKSDYVQNGSNAKAVKTVHFEYDSSLCKGVSTSLSNGKLTLKKVWFTYNGNNKGVRNPYLFFYNSNNPNYTNTANDRWGNYKSPLQNPGSSTSDVITNAEYPYALQDSISANSNAAPWTMDSIILPSTGSIKVGYESDDYAYVQNKRAMQMFNVAGLSHDAPASGSISDVLYTQQSTSTGSHDNLFVAIRVTSKVSNANDVYQKYLEGFSKIYFRLKVQMPTDRWGSGYEYVPVYADLDLKSIADSTSLYGVLSDNIIWVKLKGINISGTDVGDYSPLAKAAIQFLRLNLPSKAYPGSETGDNLDVAAAVEMIRALGSNMAELFTTFDASARRLGLAIRIDTARSLARLNNPVYKKYGGGLRVKYIKIYDNWKNMTATDSSKQAVYGQVYDYTTVKNINGVDTKISSGVACWEPMMGNEENPFRIPLEYIDKVAPLAPVTMGYTELPLGETLFPAPSVGYSQVRVSSIHSTNIKSATGYQETKFYTSYDFPVITDNSMFTPDTKKRYKTQLNDFLRIRSYHYLSMSQGFKIELNDMNGKIKSQASYSQTDSVHPIASSAYYYHVDDQNAEHKHLNNTVKVVNAHGVIDTTATIGKDIELMMDMREQRSVTEGADHEINVDLFVIFMFPVPVPSYIPMPQREETRFQSVATTKVIQRFGILDSVVAIDKGSRVSTDNLLYDSETGDVLLTRTRNEFNDTLYNFNYPAHWAYSGMGAAYQNIDAVYSGIKILNGVPQPSPGYPGMLNRFESGDEILASGRLKIGVDSSINCSQHPDCPEPVFANNPDTTRIWAIDSKKIDSTSSLGIIFIDRYGNPYSGTQVNLKIIRSGHRNMSATTVGSLTMLKSPIKKVADKLQLVIDSNKNVLSSTAIQYADIWKADARLPVFLNYNITLGAGLCDGSYSYIDNNGLLQLNGFNRSDDCSSPYTFTKCALKGSVQVGTGMTFQEAGLCESGGMTLPKGSSLYDDVLDSAFNPYIYGILGNWRADRSFVYYGLRRESDPNTKTNIRSNGVIQNFVPYWSFGSNYLVSTTDTTTYVWNAQSTLYNRKGFEIENKDPLGRYNAGAYGYNGSLPIDVVQNSRYKDQFFDGFEDYSYSTQNCLANYPLPMSIDFVEGKGILDTSVAHSGKTNLKINGLDSAVQNFPITASANIDSQRIVILKDSGEIDTLVTPQGHGLATEAPASDTVGYIGYIQADTSGFYTITSTIHHINYPNAPEGYALSVNNIFDAVNDNTTTSISVNVYLKAGEKYYMYVRTKSGSYFTSPLLLEWQRLAPCGTATVEVPTVNLYQPYADDISVLYSQGFCNGLKGIKTDSSSLLPTFTPSQSTGMVFSAWVKEQRDCLCEQYDSNAVSFTITRSSHPDTNVTFKPTGNIIEGWQRYDTVINIPADALSVRVALKSTGSSPVYFDDVRMLPYNANMNSFVYDPISLRLMAELDENNYATFYEYDDDGTLIRVKKETERGIQTVKETRSALSELNNQ
ncbi:MAG TPA: hypothetical protein VFW07_25040 [Parafilimonas sp.]|nr:hypothetical protein [Parafilimonas sp.]